MAPIRLYRYTLAHVLKAVAIAAILGLLLWYVSFQARFLIEGPTLTLVSTDINDTLSSVTLRGVAKNATSISLNGRAISTTETGSFNETVHLPSGYNVVTLNAKDRYGRTVELERGVFVN